MKTITRKRFLDLGTGLVGLGVLTSLGCGGDSGGDSGSSADGDDDGTGGSGGDDDPTTDAGDDADSSGDGGATGADDGGDGASTGETSGSTTAGEDGTGTTGGAACSSDVGGEVADNHPDPHAVTVPLSDIEAGTEQTYDITGNADHPHDLTVTSAQFAELAAGMTVVVETSGQFHTHNVTLVCS